MTINLINELAKRLKEELPGEKAHVRMAPAGNLKEDIFGNPGNAGVLILIFPNNGELSTILIKRSNYPGPHSGQISFPGGKTEEADDSQIITALREASEETGVKPGEINILGTLTPLFIPVSNLEVLPVIGYTDSRPEFKISPAEVEYLIPVTIKHLLTNRIIIIKTLNVRNHIIQAPGYSIGNMHVWGATAMILSEFIDVMSDAIAVN